MTVLLSRNLDTQTLLTVCLVFEQAISRTLINRRAVVLTSTNCDIYYAFYNKSRKIPYQSSTLKQYRLFTAVV